MLYRDVPPEEDKEFFEAVLVRFERNIWPLFKNHSISKSAAFNAFINIDMTFSLMGFFDELEDEKDDEQWRRDS